MMSGDGGLEDLPLIDLFRSEVETHSEVLSAALLALERSPGDTTRVDEMMRAAHSIKGAARVVGVGPAVRIAHVMEDCFVGAQKGNITLSPADVDVLLRGVDLLGKVSDATRDPKADLAKDFDAPVQSLVTELEAMLVPKGDARKSAGPAAATPAGGSAMAGGPDTGLEPEMLPASAPTGAGVPSATTISAPEILDSAAAESLRQQFVTAVERGCDSVRFDLRKTTDLDVDGLVLLVAVARYVAKHGRPKIRLAGISTEMRTVLEVTGLGASYAVQPGAAT